MLPYILLRIYLVDLRMNTKEKVRLLHFVVNLHSVNSILKIYMWKQEGHNAF